MTDSWLWKTLSYYFFPSAWRQSTHTSCVPVHYCSSFALNEFRINWLCCGRWGAGVTAVRTEGLPVCRYLCPPRRALTKSGAGGGVFKSAAPGCSPLLDLASGVIWGGSSTLGDWFYRHSYHEADISCSNLASAKWGHCTVAKPFALWKQSFQSI